MDYSSSIAYAAAQSKKKAASAKAKKEAAAAAKKAADDAAFQQASADQYAKNPAVALAQASKYETKAGVNPISYEGTRDVKTGELLGKYKIDPYQGEALQALKTQAFAEGSSPWAQMQLQQQALEESGARDQAAKAQAQGLAQAQGNLLRQGGLNSGARSLMAMQSAKDLARAQQDVTRKGMADRLTVGQQDIDRKQGLLSNFSNLETQAQGANIQQQTTDLTNKAQFDLAKYKEQMGAYGAAQTAKAQKAAASSGKK
jgi:hypothetical protein